MASVNVTTEQVLAALQGITEPQLPGDLTARNRIQNIRVEAGAVTLELLLSVPNSPDSETVQKQCAEAVSALPGVESVEVKMGWRVEGRAPIPPKDLVPGARNIIAVASGKGGVGKSTIAANIATALAVDGAAVGLLDADIYGPSIPIMMGVRRPPFVEDGKMTPVESHGVKLMSLGFLMKEDAPPVVWRGPMVGGAVRQMLADVVWGELDYLLVDLPPGTGDAQLTLAQSVPLTGCVIVMTSQNVAVQIASKALAMFQKLNVPILGVVENMSNFVCPHCGETTNIFTSGGGELAAERLQVPFLGSIPLDPAVVRHGDEGQPTVIAAPESPQADAFRQAARQTALRQAALHAQRTSAGEAEERQALGGLLKRFQS